MITAQTQCPVFRHGVLELARKGNKVHCEGHQREIQFYNSVSVTFQQSWLKGTLYHTYSVTSIDFDNRSTYI